MFLRIFFYTLLFFADFSHLRCQTISHSVCDIRPRLQMMVLSVVTAAVAVASYRREILWNVLNGFNLHKILKQIKIFIIFSLCLCSYGLICNNERHHVNFPIMLPYQPTTPTPPRKWVFKYANPMRGYWRVSVHNKFKNSIFVEKQFHYGEVYVRPISGSTVEWLVILLFLALGWEESVK